MKKQILFAILMLVTFVAKADDSGSCGPELTWSFVDSTKTLSISGTGNMYNYLNNNTNNYVPWYKWRKEIQNLKIGIYVTSIGQQAFYGCSSLTSVTIPNRVTSIGENAFSYCTGLTSINIGKRVTSIGENAFYYCSKLQKVIVSDIAAWCDISFRDNPLYYAHHLYSDENTEITDLVIPNVVMNIRKQAFYGCSGLASVTIPNSVTNIGEGAFCDCTGLTSITIPNSVTSIGGYAFRNCSNLTSIDIPNSVTSIGDEVFSGCTGLASINIPNSVTSLGGSAFSGCYFILDNFINNTNLTSDYNWGAIIIDKETTDGLLLQSNTIVKCRPWATSIIIPNCVTNIGQSAFSGCSDLSSIEIPNSVTSIGNYAFTSCTSLTSIEISSSVTNIGVAAFDGCSSLQKVIIADIAAWCGIKFYQNYNGGYSSNPLSLAHHLYSDENTEIKELVIPNSVTNIGEGAFCDCTGLTSITIPNSVTSISGYVFSGCTQLKSMTIHCNRPPSANNYITSQEVFDNCVLYVPAGSENAYYVADGWKNFKTIKTIDAVEKVPQDVNGDGVVDTQDVLEIYKYIQEH